MTDLIAQTEKIERHLRQGDARFEGYYIGFDSTGNEHVDRILAAVARAGKAYHHTECWGDDIYGETNFSYTDLIQEAANLAAAQVER